MSSIHIRCEAGQYLLSARHTTNDTLPRSEPLGVFPTWEDALDAGDEHMHERGETTYRAFIMSRGCRTKPFSCPIGERGDDLALAKNPISRRTQC